MKNSIFSAKWIKAPVEFDRDPIKFKRTLNLKGKVKKAVLNITANGVYEAFVNDSRVGDFILAPGWTNYYVRLQYQTYDITSMLSGDCELTVNVGGGWYAGAITRAWNSPEEAAWRLTRPISLLASIDVEYEDDTTELFVTDGDWFASKWNVLYSDIYHGERYDANAVLDYKPVLIDDKTFDTLVPTDGEKVVEHETILPVKEIITPNGERVIDFGQEITGYVAFDVTAKAGDRIVIDHGEVLDADGNFYRENLRKARAQIEYICKDGRQSYKPHHTYMGFRYIRLNECPADIPFDAFKGVVVYSDLKRTGRFNCSNEKINKLYSNLVWSNKDNYLDVPTDCPQRDERLGWMGDAQVFVKTATYNFDVRRFFRKWLRDLASSQYKGGGLPHVVPNVISDAKIACWGDDESGAAWADAGTICPWQIYVSYADRDILEEMLPTMEKYIEYLENDGDDPYRWTSGAIFGDWLSFEPTDKYFICDAFYAYSLSIVIKALKVCGRDSGKYESLYENVVKAFKKNYPEYHSQTECVLALHFDLTDDRKGTAAKLVEMLKNNDYRLATGFVGTPYLLHVLSSNGYSDVAYTLLLQEKCPSWLYPVNRGATTIWEHWDAIKEDGTFQNVAMTSFNHYAYGSVGDWLYGAVCGVTAREDAPGYKEFNFAPIADARLDFAEMEYDCDYGTIKAGWKKKDGGFEYHLTVPEGTCAHVKIGETDKTIGAGDYTF